MRTHVFGMSAKYLLAVFLCVALTLTLILAKSCWSPFHHQRRADQARQVEREIQKIIDQSNERFQAAEMHFKEKDYQAARQAYTHAANMIIESVIDVRSSARLKQHFQNLNDRIVRRQIAVSQAAFADALDGIAARPDDDPSSGAPAASAKEALQEAQDGDTQPYDPSPLDELATLKLKKEEERAASKAKVKAAIAAANFDFTIEPDASIQSFIHYHQNRGRAAMASGLRRSGRYMRLAREIFMQEGVPQDLVWMAQVESAWSPRARSWASAVGLWQFIPATGKRYGLRQNDWIDERMSFEYATRASARYLRWLGQRYDGNWELALAGYNAGERAVDRAIAKAGHSDFWKVCELELLPRETRNYVPNILATIVIGKNPRQYDFNVKPARALVYDIVLAKIPVSLRLVADAIDASYESLLALNPELRRGITPPGMAYDLRIPTGKRDTLQATLRRIPPNRLATWRMITAREDDTFAVIARQTKVSEKHLAAVNKGVLKPGEKVIIPLSGRRPKSPIDSRRATANRKAKKNSMRIGTHRIKLGETLAGIAARYGISTRQLAALNGLNTRTKLPPDRILKVPIGQKGIKKSVTRNVPEKATGGKAPVTPQPIIANPDKRKTS